jgi:hypothetical protein
MAWPTSRAKTMVATRETRRTIKVDTSQPNFRRSPNMDTTENVDQAETF